MRVCDRAGGWNGRGLARMVCMRDALDPSSLACSGLAVVQPLPALFLVLPADFGGFAS